MHELIYTSASKGLTSGSRGFCTVAATKSMAKSLSKKLEGLSGYNHVYDPGNSDNPVNYSFVTLKDSRQTHYVLSRICDAGLDYTQRSNKFAHHIALAKSELPSAGPAWALQSSGLFQVAWGDAQTPYHIDDSIFPDGNVAAAVCTSWQSLLGDAGYGGVIAGQLVDRAIKDMVIAYELGTDILGLISESLAIIPHNERWRATFSTFAGKPNANYTCKLRCVLAGSEEAQKAAGNKRVRFLDLTNPAPIEHENEYVVAARSGQITQPDVAPPGEQPKRWVEETPVDDGLQQVTQAPSILSSNDVDLVEPEPTVSRPTSIFDDSDDVGGIGPPPLPRQRGRGFGRIVVGLSAMALLMLILCGGGGGAYYYVWTQRSAGPNADDLIASNPPKVDDDKANSNIKPPENKPTENKPTENKPTENKPTENKPTENKPPEKQPPEKKPPVPPVVNIAEIQKEFDRVKNTLANSEKLKKSGETYTFRPYTGPSAKEISDQADNLGGTPKIGTALQDKFVALREQSFKGGGLHKEDQDAAAIVDGIATKLLTKSKYTDNYNKLITNLVVPDKHVEYLNDVENLLNNSKTKFSQLRGQLGKAKSVEANQLDDKIAAQISLIEGILQTSKMTTLQAAINNARKVPKPADKKATIASSLKADKHHALIVEMFTGDPLTWMPNKTFIPADNNNYLLEAAKLVGGGRIELQLSGDTSFKWPTVKVNNWLRHFVSQGSAKNIPANDKTNIYPICWLGISIGQNEAKLEPEGGKYIAKLDAGQIDIELEISQFTPNRPSPNNDKEFVKLFVNAKQKSPAIIKKVLLDLKGKLYFTYGSPGSENLIKIPVGLKDIPDKVGANFGPRPKGYMLVDKSTNQPANVPLDHKLRWRINTGKWEHAEGKVERLKIQYPTGEPQNREAINLDRIDGTNKAGDEFIMVLRGSVMIVQSDAFEYDDDDFNSYLLWKLTQGKPPLLQTLHSPKPSFIEYIKAKIKSDLPEAVVKYLEQPTFESSFKRYLDSIIAKQVLDGGYDALAISLWRGGQTTWTNTVGKTVGGLNNQEIKNRQIKINNYPICTYLELYKLSGGDELNKAVRALANGQNKKPNENITQFNSRRGQLQSNYKTKLNNYRRSWLANFKNKYITKLSDNITSQFASSGGIDLFRQKQKMIQSFELQVLNSDDEPMGPIYKLALTDP